MHGLFLLWLPLAVSFELMMLEGPAFQGVMGRLPDPALNLAAWGLAMGISLLIESPVIMLLGTAVALARDADSFAALRRFMLTLCAGCTAVTAMVAFTPLYDLVARGIMGQPEDIVAAARPALQSMLFWSAAIGWRRFYQGVLVSHGHTRWVTYGTVVRLVAAVGTAVGLMLWGHLTGVQVAALAIMAAVVSEAIMTTLFARPIVRREVLTLRRTDLQPVTQGAIWRYHLPLAATSMLALIAGPMTAAALARLPDPRAALAAWPVAFMALLVIRGGAMAYQEITVSQARMAGAPPVLRTFAWWLGWGCTALTLALLATPLLSLYLRSVVHVPAELHGLVRLAVLLGIALPLLTALASWVRGLLMASGKTTDVYRAMVVGLTCHAALLAAGVALRAPAMWVASAAMTAAAAVEFAVLAARARRG